MDGAVATPEIAVGRRVALDERRGTVRYVGPVQAPGMDGLWLGIEWDDPSADCHDGAVAGRRYFTCRRPGSRASFVRAASVAWGVSLEVALCRRYAAADEADEAEGAEGAGDDETLSATLRSATQRDIPVALIGARRIRARQRSRRSLVHRDAADARLTHRANPQPARTADAGQRCRRRGLRRRRAG